MRVVSLASEIDFAGWREAARSLRLEGVEPTEVVWTVAGQDGGLFAAEPPRADGAISVPRDFVDLAGEVILNRAADRFDLLYRMLWRLGREPALMKLITDPDVARARDMAKAVSRAAHKMKAFVRFREMPDAKEESYAAWFEPPHRVTEKVAPFFVRRFTAMRFSIFTPDASAHWDGRDLTFTGPASRDAAPEGDVLEEIWRTYYASTFNPARLKVRSMQGHMPKQYWRNLPEARLIPELIASASERTAAMVAHPPTQPSARAARAALRQSRDGSFNADIPTSLEEVAAGIRHCRRCDLWRDATQGVAGEGPAQARLMIVGEQPGDQEDLAGRPFVGPAGQLFDRAATEAGLPREQVWVTNAVKHFKHEPRGKRRIHQTPNAGEVAACRWWLDAERRLVRPRVILAMGATAALGVFGKATPIGANRGKPIQLPDQSQGIVTWHPSFLLRVPDEETRERAYREFIGDLRTAWEMAS